MHGDGWATQVTMLEFNVKWPKRTFFALLYKDKALDPSPFIHSEHAQDEYSLYESSTQKGR